MSGPLEGIRVVEMASWMFVPSAASVLVDWGADVLKVENPEAIPRAPFAKRTGMTGA